MNEYSAEQLANVRSHCEEEIKARRRWAKNLSQEIQERMSMEACSFANDIYCIRTDVQVETLIRHFYRMSHGTDHGTKPDTDVLRQWDAAISGQPFDGEFSFFQNAFPDNGAAHDFGIRIPGL